jgi:DNA-binding MarR family transcriptional regulator
MALGFLLDGAAKSATQMAREANVTSQTMTGIIANLESKDLVDRHPSPDHARVHLFTLTPSGEELAGRAHTLAMAVEQDLLDALSDRERTMLAGLLERLTQLAPTAGLDAKP